MMKTFLAGAIVAWLLCSFAWSEADVLETQRQRWASATVLPRWKGEARAVIKWHDRNSDRFAKVASMRPNGVPPLIGAALLYRESGMGKDAFLCNPANGDSLRHKTIHVPRGRPPGTPPFAWEVAAADAYYVVDRLDLVNWREIGHALQGIESFNGLGYQHAGRVSPYLWSGTTVYRRGKYVADGRFDPYAVDQQTGVAAILLEGGWKTGK